MKTQSRETGKNIILALQHLIAMFGATVLVPMLTGLNPSIALFTAGIGTLIFHFVTGRKVPVFLGSSFAFIAVINVVKDAHAGDFTYAQGGLLVAGILYVIISLIMRVVKYETIKKFLPAYVIGPMIMVIGLNLVPTAYGMAKDNFLLAIITLASALLINFLGKGLLKQMSIITAVAIGYIVASFMGKVDVSTITAASFIQLPPFTLPKFDLASILVIAPVVLAVFMEHVGDITTNGQVVGKDFIKDPGLHKTLLGDGLATAFAALVGGPANTTYGENTGVLAITRNYNPAILRLAAVFAVILAFVGKLGGVLGSIPLSVMGGISLMLFTMIAIIGFKTIRSGIANREMKMNWKSIIIIAVVLFIGMGPNYVNLISPGALSIGIKINENVSLEGMSLAALSGIILNIVFNFIESKMKKS